MQLRLRFLVIALPFAFPVSVPAGVKKYIRLQEPSILEDTVSCASLVAVQLFSPGHDIVVLHDRSADASNAIARILMRNGIILITEEPRQTRNSRTPSYIVVDDEFVHARRVLLEKSRPLRTLQYLFVTKAGEKEMSGFTGDLWRAGFRDIAFLSFNEARNTTVVVRARSEGKGIVLKTVGFCTSSWNNVHSLERFGMDIYRFCPEEGCRLKYGGVTDATVNFWRNEDALRRREHSTPTTLGARIIRRFGKHNNVIIDTNVRRNFTWAEASRELINENVDVVNGLMSDDLDVMEGIEIVCWYMHRDMVFASQVYMREHQNDLFKMLEPFHYLVWMSIGGLLFLYTLLFYALRRLAYKGLIREQVQFVHVFMIMIGQGVTLPSKFGLKLVLLLWMLFSLYLSITYNSTFTSSLAQIETEDLLRGLKELRDSEQPLGGPAIIRTYLNASDDQIIKDLYERYTLMTPEEALGKIFKNKTVVAIQQFTVNSLNWANRRNRTLRIYTLPESVVRFPVFFFARKGYPFYTALRKLVQLYRSTGLIDQGRKMFIIEENKNIVLQPSEDEILSMKHLRTAFNLFFILQGISCMLLLVEMAQAYVSRKRSEGSKETVKDLRKLHFRPRRTRPSAAN